MVVASEDPDSVVDRFADIAEVVALVERSSQRAVGVTPDGVPVTLTVVPAASFGTALIRATGSPEYVAALEPLPEGPT